VIASLSRLAQLGSVKKKSINDAIRKYQIHDVRAAEAGNTEGSG
jgi:pyruvate dehydrogenase E1 component